MGTKIEMAARACQIGDIQTVRFLLNGHVSADELDQQGCGLLHWAAINDKVDIIELLLSHNSNIDLIGGNMRSTPLHWACYNSQLSAVVCLVKNGANPTLRNANGETALHVATKNANTTIITYLLVKFKNIVDLRDHSGCSALLCAASSGFGLFPIRTFIQFDAYLDFTDDETGDTALHVTMKRQNLVAAVDLIYAGADETKKNKKGQTAFDLVDEKLVKHVKEHVEIRKIREKGTRCEKMKSRGFLMNVFTATITGILLFVGLVLFILTNFWVVVSLLAVSIPLTIFFLRKKRMDHFGYLPVTYIFWMGMAELGLLICNSEGLLHWSILITMCSIWVISASFFWVLLLTDPGVLPRSSNPKEEFIRAVEESKVSNFCFTCWIPKPISNHHCSQCDKCVDGFDHHCPWIHKCVYRKNLRAFVFFCLTNFLFDVFYAPVLLSMIIISWNNVGFNQMLAEHGLMVISFFISIPHILGAGSITFVQLSQISRHVTTIEVLRKTQEQRQSHSGSTSISSTRELNPWDPAPSWKTRIRNIWNLLAFDKFGSEEVSYQSDISFDTLSSRAI